MEVMRANADQLIAVQQTSFPAMKELHPDKIFEGFPLLDQFWYVDAKGTWVLF